MENIDTGKINIFGLNITSAGYGFLLSKIFIAISQNGRLSITYANADVLNGIYKNNGLRDKLNSFSIIHPDGIGVFIASRLIYGNNGLKQRITGSDFYPMLIQEAVKRDWSIYFFGHDTDTLKKIKESNPDLNTAGFSEGYNYNTEKVINDINGSNTKILIVGLGFPLQEEWIYLNKDKLNCNVIIAVGDGIKVFSKTKIRGPVILRRLGLEWFIRLVSNPVKYWKRYLIGNPLFLYRTIKIKLSKFENA